MTIMRTLKVVLPFLAAMTLSISNMAAQEPTVYMISNAHFDTQWRWDVRQSIGEFLPNTLEQNFQLMEAHKDYKFNFEGAVKYLWIKEYYPEAYKKLTEYVKDGRWYPAGSSWDANDWNVPSCESNFRNILLAQEFYKKEFGLKSSDIMLPDCFGFGYTLPTIASHCGVIGFHTQKLQWRSKPFYHDGSKYPFLFGIWEGIDGAKILAVPHGGNYSWNPDSDLFDNKELAKMLEQSATGEVFRYYGTRSSRLHGDQGGSPIPLSVKIIEDDMSKKGSFVVKSSTVGEFFNDHKNLLNENVLPVYKGELLMDVHGTGCYTSVSDEKLLNRRSEELGNAAESSAAIADYVGAVPYPQYTINEAYKRFIWHQFHDDLPGTCITEAYAFSWNDQMLSQNQFSGVIESSVAGIASGMDTKVKGTPVVVYNPVSADNKDVVSITVPADGFVEVYSPNGKKVKSQIISKSGDKCDVIFSSDDPSLGLSVYDLRFKNSRPSTAKTSLKVGDNSIENAVYKVTLDSNGDISSILDKRFGRELVKAGSPISLSVFSNNESNSWPAWEILKKVMDQKPSYVTNDVSITTEQAGPLKATIKVERKYGNSSFVQYISLTDGAYDDRIDIKNSIDWQERNSLLKASFPLSFSCKEAAYDLGLGYIKRGNNTETAYEVPAQQWADMTSDDGSYGVTIMNDCKYGWDKPDDNTLRLTLLHTPSAKKGYGNQQTLDIGPHEFTYSIVGHSGALDGGEANLLADALSQRKVAVAVDKHIGSLGRQYSFVSTSTPELRIRSFKKAEDGDGYIVRVYELSGKGIEGTVDFNAPILSAEVTNGIEEAQGVASVSGSSLKVKAGAFSPNTFRVRFSAPAAKVERSEYSPINLDFDKVAISSDAFSAFGHFDKDWHSFSAELLPETLVCKGVPFTFGEADFANALTCKGQTVTLPKNSKGAYFLAASSDGDRIAEFTSGTSKCAFSVPYYSDFFGGGNWEGTFTAFLKEGDVAYVGSHRHDSRMRNEPYVHTYMFMVYVPVAEGVDKIVLPKDEAISVFSATALQGNSDEAELLSDLVVRLKPNKE